jgi:hypothetical protein
MPLIDKLTERPMSSLYKTTVSKPPISASVAKRHSGKWIALRGTRVAASAETYFLLQSNPRVRPTDAVYRVPIAGSHRFLAAAA